ASCSRFSNSSRVEAETMCAAEKSSALPRAGACCTSQSRTSARKGSTPSVPLTMAGSPGPDGHRHALDAVDEAAGEVVGRADLHPGHPLDQAAEGGPQLHAGEVGT